MTNSKNTSKSSSVSILLVAAAVAPFLLSACGGLSKSDRETVEIPPVAVGTDANAPTSTASADATLINLEQPAAPKPTPAPTPTPTPVAPPYSLSDAVKYVVESGDSLSVIAAKYGASMGDVMKANKIKNANKIRIGQTLLLPAKAEEGAEVTTAEAPSSSVENVAPVTADGTASGINSSGLTLPSLSGE